MADANPTDDATRRLEDAGSGEGGGTGKDIYALEETDEHQDNILTHDENHASETKTNDMGVSENGARDPDPSCEPPLKRCRVSDDPLRSGEDKDGVPIVGDGDGLGVSPSNSEFNSRGNAPETEKKVKGSPETLEVTELQNEADENDDQTASEKDSGHPPQGQKLKKRKVVLILAYCGFGYQGMQKNPGAKTIEGELQSALLKANAMQNIDLEMKSIEWNRAARTDKGVSAVGQVVSARLCMDPPPFRERVNSFLPESIRLLHAVRATNGFNAKNLCERRRYEYLIPVFAFDPLKHRDRGSLEELAMVKDKMKSKEFISSADLVPSDCVQSENADLCNPSLGELNDENDVDSLFVNGTPNFKFDAAMLERLRTLLNKFCGTHNFHNFTTRTNANDPSANRYIVSFSADGPIQIEGLDFIRCEVLGQSFMLHQIRKMIGGTLAIMRDHVPETYLDYAFRKDKKVNVPMAPELGLFLAECLFNSYNRKFGSTHEEISLSKVKSQVDDFKLNVIYKHIASSEKKEHVMANWLPNLNDRNYPEFVDARKESNESKQ